MIRALALGIAVMAPMPAHSAEPSPGDRQALLQLAERMDQAWTAGDASANAELFASNATARFGDDPLGKGRYAIRNQFRGFFKDRPPGLRHVTAIERVEQLAPNLATWDAEIRVERRQSSGSWETLTKIRNVTIVVRQSDGWRIQTVRAFPVR